MDEQFVDIVVKSFTTTARARSFALRGFPDFAAITARAFAAALVRAAGGNFVSDKQAPLEPEVRAVRLLRAGRRTILLWRRRFPDLARGQR